MALAAKTARLALGRTVIDAQYLADSVIFMNNDIIAINKPYGLPVHSGPGVKLCIMDMIDEFTEIKKLKQRPELAHRLDRDCSGTLLFTRSTGAATKIAEMFANGTIHKQYWAVTVGVPAYEEGEINIPIGEAKLSGGHRIVTRRDLIGKSSQVLRSAGFKIARTKFKILDTNEPSCALLQVEPITGLKQQIRVHVAEGLKCPILGDHKFSSDIRQPQVLPLRLLQLLQIRGTRNKEDPKAKGKIREWQRALIPLHLHARQLTLPKFYHGRDIVIKAPLPEYYEETLQLLKLHPKRKNMEQTHDLPEYYRLKQLEKLTRK